MSIDDYDEMKKKMNEYEETINKLMDDSIIIRKIKKQEIILPECVKLPKKATQNPSLFDSVYIEKDDGEELKCRRSKNGDFCIIEESNLNDKYDMTKSMKVCYNEQNFSHTYEKTEKFVKKGSKVWNVLGSVIYVGKWFVGCI